MKNILFVCTGNTCRSPMAQAVFNHIAESDEFVSDSCGIFADNVSEISDNAKAVLSKNGIDFAHTSKKVSLQLMENADIVICMTHNHYEMLSSLFPEYSDKIFVMPKDISDPYGSDIEVYNMCYNEIYRGILDVIKELKETK